MRQTKPPCPADDRTRSFPRSSAPTASSPLLPPVVRVGGIIAVSVLILVLAFIVVFGNGTVSYTYSAAVQRFASNAAVFSALILALIGIAAFVRKRRLPPRDRSSECGGRKQAERFFRNRCALICATLFLVEMLITSTSGFLPGWDVAAVTGVASNGMPINAFNLIVDGGPGFPYFAIYPNNVFIASLFIAICKIVPNPFVLMLLACACVSLSIFLISRIVLALTGSTRWSVASLVLAIALIGLLPWFFVPYSDVFGLMAVTAALWAHTCISKPLPRWSAFFAFAAVGYLFKPTAVFLPIALLLVSAVAALARRRLPAPRTALRAGAGALLGCGLTALLYFALVIPTGYVAHPDRAFTATHYLMMGMNEETGGRYSHSDVRFSLDHPEKEEREKANLEEAWKRVSDMGPLGTARLFAKKVLTTYNDGTFGWGQDMPFFPPDQERYQTAEKFEQIRKAYEAQMENPISQALDSYYWRTGSHYQAFLTIQQGVWLATLLGIALCLIGMATSQWRRLDPRAMATIVAALAALVMLTVFLMVFECGARYIYLYAGLYIVVATWGYRCFVEFARTIRRERKRPCP